MRSEWTHSAVVGRGTESLCACHRVPLTETAVVVPGGRGTCLGRGVRATLLQHGGKFGLFENLLRCSPHLCAICFPLLQVRGRGSSNQGASRGSPLVPSRCSCFSRPGLLPWRREGIFEVRQPKHVRPWQLLPARHVSAPCVQGGSQGSCRAKCLWLASRTRTRPSRQWL